MSDAQEKLTKLMEHCCGCPFFSYEDRNNEGLFFCALLKDECYKNCKKEGNCEECEDADILAIATYDKEGKITNLEFVSKYPKECPRDNYVLPDVIFESNVAHHHIDMGNWALRESLNKKGTLHYAAFDKKNGWLVPVFSLVLKDLKEK